MPTTNLATLADWAAKYHTAHERHAAIRRAYQSDDEIRYSHTNHVLDTLALLRDAYHRALEHAVADLKELEATGLGAAFPVSHTVGKSAATMILREIEENQ